jgi:CRISPR-associated protein Cas2
MKRILYIVAYDVRKPERLNRVRYFLKGYSTGGQKSVYECFLTDVELKIVTRKLNSIIREDEDRIHIFALDGRSKTHTLGIAIQPKDPSFFYIG